MGDNTIHLLANEWFRIIIIPVAGVLVAVTARIIVAARRGRLPGEGRWSWGAVDCWVDFFVAATVLFLTTFSDIGTESKNSSAVRHALARYLSGGAWLALLAAGSWLLASLLVAQYPKPKIFEPRNARARAHQRRARRAYLWWAVCVPHLAGAGVFWQAAVFSFHATSR